MSGTIPYDGRILSVTLSLSRGQAAELGLRSPEGFAPTVTIEMDTGRDEFRALLSAALTNKGGKASAGLVVAKRGRTP